MKTNVKAEGDIVQTTITTTVEETTVNKRQLDLDITFKQDFDLSARKYIDWIDSIERILDDKQSSNLRINERQEIIQEVKAKYVSYDEQFKALVQTGNTITRQLSDGRTIPRCRLTLFFFSANEDYREHDSSLKLLERRWQALYKQIVRCEHDLDQSSVTTKFDEEFQTLIKARNEYQTWIETSLPTSSIAEVQVDIRVRARARDDITSSMLTCIEQICICKTSASKSIIDRCCPFFLSPSCARFPVGECLMVGREGESSVNARLSYDGSPRISWQMSDRRIVL